MKVHSSARIVAHSCYQDNVHWLEYHIHHLTGEEHPCDIAFKTREGAYRTARSMGYGRVYGRVDKNGLT